MFSHRNAAGRAALFVVGVAVAAALAGCYTVLKHPGTSMVADGGEGERDCYSCHGPNGVAHAYDPLYSPAFDYYPDTWYGYYAYPWWWRDYWHDDLYGQGGGGGQARDTRDDDGRRHLWGRGAAAMPSLPPIYDNPAAAPSPAGQPAEQPPAPSSSQQPGRNMKNPPNPAPTPPPPAPDSPNNNRQTPPPKDDSKKDRKDKDDSGGRGGER